MYVCMYGPHVPRRCLHRLEVDTVCAGAALSACEPPGSSLGSRFRLVVKIGE